MLGSPVQEKCRCQCVFCFWLLEVARSEHKYSSEFACNRLKLWLKHCVASCGVSLSQGKYCSASRARVVFSFSQQLPEPWAATRSGVSPCARVLASEEWQEFDIQQACQWVPVNVSCRCLRFVSTNTGLFLTGTGTIMLKCRCVYRVCKRSLFHTNVFSPSTSSSRSQLWGSPNGY